MIANTDVIIAGNMSPFMPNQIVTSGYETFPRYATHWSTTRKPAFTLRIVPYMLDDSRVRYGLWLFSAPISANMKIEVECDNPEAGDFISKTFTRFWSAFSHIPLQAIQWGYHASEVIYTYRDHLVEFHSLRSIHPFDSRVLTRRGGKVGVVVRRVHGTRGVFSTMDEYHAHGRMYLMGPKSFWHVHMREEHQWYGISRLRFAYPHWHDKFRDGGSVDSLSLFFFKYALQGSRIYYPTQQKKLPDGTLFNPEQHAERLAIGMRTGATLQMPNERDANGNRLWEIEDATNTATGTELIDYQQLLDDYILQAMGIPSEVIEAGASGSGYAGRRVPAQAFYQILQQYGEDLVFDFDAQIMLPLMHVNGWGGVRYSLHPKSLLGEPEEVGGPEGAQTGGGLSTSTLRGASGSAVLAPRENPHQ